MLIPRLLHNATAVLANQASGKSRDKQSLAMDAQEALEDPEKRRAHAVVVHSVVGRVAKSPDRRSLSSRLEWSSRERFGKVLQGPRQTIS